MGKSRDDILRERSQHNPLRFFLDAINRALPIDEEAERSVGLALRQRYAGHVSRTLTSVGSHHDHDRGDEDDTRPFPYPTKPWER